MDGMDDSDLTPPTQPSGALIPPTRLPPTAVAAVPAPLPHQPTQKALRDASPLRRFIRQTLNAVDDAADTVADLLDLRRA